MRRLNIILFLASAFVPGLVRSQDADRGSQAAETITPPSIIKQVPPVMTPSMKSKKLQGEVFISLVVDAAGTPTRLSVAKGLDSEYDQAALDAVMKFQFTPATKNGRPVPVMLKVAVTFKRQ